MDNDALSAPVFWYEGMLLKPHHFQQHELFRERVAAVSMDAHNPYFYGFLRHKVDTGALAGGVFRLSECEAIMPDGAFVTASDAASPLERHLEPLREEMRRSRQPVILYLGVPRIRSESPAVGSAGEKIVPPPRFIRGERRVQEMARPGQDTEQTIEVLRLNARILLNENEREGYVAMPCAQLKYVSDSFSLDDKEWLPPLVRVTKASALWTMLDGFVGEIRQGIRALTPKGQAARGGSSLELRMQAMVLGASAAALEGLLSCEAPPSVCYRELCRLLGGMCGFPRSKGLEPQKALDYRHEESMAVFSQLLNAVRLLLPTTETVERYAFTHEEGGLYTLPFKPEWETKALYLEARGADPARVIEWVENAFICSGSTLKECQVVRYLGAPRSHEESPPFVLADEGRGTVVFSLSLPKGKERLVLKPLREDGAKLVVHEGVFVGGKPPLPEGLALLIPGESGE